MTSNTISSRLDYKIESLNDRKDKVNQIIEQSDEELANYFDDYYNPSLTQSSRLSDSDPMCRQLERMADYLLYADDKEKKEDKKKVEYLRKHQWEYRYKNEKMTDAIPDISECDVDRRIATRRNYYLDNNTKVTSDDRNSIIELNETGELLGFLRFCIVAQIYPHKEEEVLKFLSMNKDEIKKFVELNYSEEGVENRRVSKKEANLYINIMKGIYQDEVIIKESFLGTIRFKNAMQSSPSFDLVNFSFANQKHVRFIIDNYSDLVDCSYESSQSDLKHILYDFEGLVDSLEEYEKDVIVWHIDGMAVEDIILNLKNTHSIEVNKSRAYDIIGSSIPRKISEAYKESKLDWLYTHVIKGNYKTCKKCEKTKLALKSNFRKDKRGLYGLRSECKECSNK